MFADKRKSHRTLNTSIQERIHNMGKLLIVSISDHEEHILNKIMEIIADEPELDHIALPPSNASLSFPHLEIRLKEQTVSCSGQLVTLTHHEIGRAHV